MKNSALFLGLFFAAFSLKAQIKNGDMTGTSLNYAAIAENQNTPSAGAGWGGYYGSTRPLNIVSVKDGTNDVIQLTPTAPNLDVMNNPRLVQRLASLAPGNYRLTFKVKTINSNTTKIRPTVRSTGSNIPGYMLKDYSTGAPCFKELAVSATWTTYSVDFDLTATSSSITTYSTDKIVSGITAKQTPVICFSLQTTAAEIAKAGAEGIGVMIDDVSFTLLNQ